MFHNRRLIPDGLQINHDNGIKTDNVISNFVLLTNQKNVQHAFDTGLAKRTEAANIKAVMNNPRAVFTSEEVSKYRELYSRNGINAGILAQLKGCSIKTALDMLNMKTYTHV